MLRCLTAPHRLSWHPIVPWKGPLRGKLCEFACGLPCCNPTARLAPRHVWECTSRHACLGCPHTLSRRRRGRRQPYAGAHPSTLTCLALLQLAAMPSAAKAVRRLLKRLHKSRRIEQLEAIRALGCLADTSAGRQALFAAGALPDLLERASNSEPLVARSALAVLNGLSNIHASPEQERAATREWRAAMLAGRAVPLLLGLLESSHEAVQSDAIVAIGLLASGAEPAAAAALVQHGAAPLLVSLVRHTRSPDVRNNAAAALHGLSRMPVVADALLRSGTVEALAPLLLSDTVTEETQQFVAGAVGSLAASSEQCGVQVVHAGGIRALVRAVAGGSTTVAEAAVGSLLAATKGTSAVWTAVAAEGGIPVLEAFCCSFPNSKEVQGAEQLLSEMRSVQQAQQEEQRACCNADEASGVRSAAAAQPASPQPASGSAAASQPSSPQPAAHRRASRRVPHVCAWCGGEAPAGVRFKKCAACQQVGGLPLPRFPWLLGCACKWVSVAASRMRPSHADSS